MYKFAFQIICMALNRQIAAKIETTVKSVYFGLLCRFSMCGFICARKYWVVQLRTGNVPMVLFVRQYLSIFFEKISNVSKRPQLLFESPALLEKSLAATSW